MRSIKWAPTGAAIRRQPCSRCSIRSRTRTSRITTWKSPMTCRRCCSSPRPTSSTRSLRRCATAWRSSGSPGRARLEFGVAGLEDQVGAVTGVGVNEYGGDVMTVEAILMQGRGEFALTGQIGKVMEESARAAVSYARSHALELGLKPGFFEDHFFHIHVPAGAIPKDGPSAGITMATAVVSVLTDRPVRRDVAMTGEITLRGKVLPIGGLKEQLLADHRAGIRTDRKSVV